MKYKICNITNSSWIYRKFWNFIWLITCSWTPVYMWTWRRFILRLFGARIPVGSDVRSSVKIWDPANLEMGVGSILADDVWCYNVDKIYIGDHVIVSQGAVLCTASHDINSKSFQLITSPIRILNGAWIAAESFIGPGVEVGSYAVLGARSVTFSNLVSSTIYAGNPAKIINIRIINV